MPATVGVVALQGAFRRHAEVLEDLGSQQDQTRAGAEDGQAGGQALPERAGELRRLEEAADGRRLPAGEDKRLDLGQVARQAHLDRLRADVADGGHVLADRALHGEDTDTRRPRDVHDGRLRYQPRTASRSSGGISPSDCPRIGSPRPVLTSTRMSGLS
ncbi:MAG TPA: hypothetical protein VJ653_03945 [Acidimicrobiales bacterium]|nr:hypothetical protein [Acidimicrobiales bacterium]